MKISLLRKIYPFLDNRIKNIKWRQITDEELNASLSEKQVIANCYNESVRHALLITQKGREIIKNRIKKEKDTPFITAYKCSFFAKDKYETFRATKKDYYDSYYNLQNAYYKKQHSNFFVPRISLGIDICVTKMIKKHPSLKSFLSRIYLEPIFYNRICEFNKPSNAFKWYTGKTPTIIGENDLNLNLNEKKYRTKTLELLNHLGKKDKNEYSFVALSGVKEHKNLKSWHTLPIINIDRENQIIEMIDKRSNKKLSFSFDDFLKNFKAIIGMEL